MCVYKKVKSWRKRPMRKPDPETVQHVTLRWKYWFCMWHHLKLIPGSLLRIFQAYHWFQFDPDTSQKLEHLVVWNASKGCELQFLKRHKESHADKSVSTCVHAFACACAHEPACMSVLMMPIHRLAHKRGHTENWVVLQFCLSRIISPTSSQIYEWVRQASASLQIKFCEFYP